MNYLKTLQDRLELLDKILDTPGEISGLIAAVTIGDDQFRLPAVTLTGIFPEVQSFCPKCKNKLTVRPDLLSDGIVEVIAAHLDPDLFRQAVQDARMEAIRELEQLLLERAETRIQEEQAQKAYDACLLKKLRQWKEDLK